MSQPTVFETFPTVAHLLRVDEKIERLQRKRADILASAIEEIRRSAPLTLAEIASLMDSWLDAGTVGRRDMLEASGWSHHSLRMGYIPEPDPDYCVYVLIGEDGPQYVGRSTSVRDRVKAHRREGRIPFVRHEVYGVADERAARDLEAILIQQHRPPFNRRIERRPR